MYYNGKFIECDYIFNKNNSSMLFEKLAYAFLNFIVEREKQVKFWVHTEMNLKGEFLYCVRAYKEDEELASYEVKNFNNYYSECIYDNGLLVFNKREDNIKSLAWDKNFFGIDTYLCHKEDFMKVLDDYRAL